MRNRLCSWGPGYGTDYQLRVREFPADAKQSLPDWIDVVCLSTSGRQLAHSRLFRRMATLARVRWRADRFREFIRSTTLVERSIQWRSTWLIPKVLENEHACSEQ